MSFYIFPACQHKCTPIVTFTLGKLRSRNCGFLSGPMYHPKALTLVAYLNSNPYCYVVLLFVLIPIQALMSMPYYIFPNAFSEPKAEEETRRLRLASLLHPRGLRHCPVRPRPRPSGCISDTETPPS
jgi:hypothetical protein